MPPHLRLRSQMRNQNTSNSHDSFLQLAPRPISAANIEQTFYIVKSYSPASAPPCPIPSTDQRTCSPWPSLDKGVEVAVLCGPSWIKILKLQFSVALRGPSWIKVLKLQFSVALRGPPWIKKLTLQFFACLRGPSRIKVLTLQFSVDQKANRPVRGSSPKTKN